MPKIEVVCQNAPAYEKSLLVHGISFDESRRRFEMKGWVSYDFYAEFSCDMNETYSVVTTTGNGYRVAFEKTQQAIDFANWLRKSMADSDHHQKEMDAAEARIDPTTIPRAKVEFDSIDDLD